MSKPARVFPLVVLALSLPALPPTPLSAAPTDAGAPQPTGQAPADPPKAVDPTGPTPIAPPPVPLVPPVAEVKHLGAVNVAGVKLEGLTLAAAREKLLTDLVEKLDTLVRLTAGTKVVPRTRRDLGASLDLDAMLAAADKGDKFVPLRLKVNRAGLRDCLADLVTEFKLAGSNAKLVDEAGKVRIVGGEPKRELNLDESVKSLAAALEQDASALKLTPVFTETPSDVPASTFAGINGRLARYATPYNPAEKDRSENMRLAIAAIDGLLIPAGAVFSLNDTVGQRTPERGYRKAHIFEDGKITEGYGGGVSQVTGTLFNAALFGGLHILTYRTHSRPVRYLPVGRDATVAWGQFDMKFKNDTDTPVFVRYALEKKQVVCTLYGQTVPGRKITLSVTSTRLADNLIEAKLTRIFVVGGKPTRTEVVGKSHYEWVPEEPKAGR